jgi:hypothetical protein
MILFGVSWTIQIMGDNECMAIHIQRARYH